MKLTDWLPLAQQIHKHTCQIVQAGGPLGYKPRGTGVLVEFQNERYLLTASHVIEEDVPIYITVKKGYGKLKIDGDIAISNLEYDSYIDIACIRLRKEAADILMEENTFLPQSSIDFTHKADSQHTYMVSGYPASDTKQKKGFVEVRCSFLMFKHSKNKVYQHYKIDSNKCIILNNTGKITHHLTGRKIKRDLAPHGMSGGGLWVVQITSDNPLVFNYALVGIVTEYKRERYDVILGSKIDLFIEMITELKIAFQ